MDNDSYQHRLEYHPSLENSLIAQSALGKDAVEERTGRRFAGLRAVTGTLAQRVEGGKVVARLCHANVALTVRDGFKDVSRDHKVCRLRRHWTAPLNATTGALAGGLTLFRGPPDPGRRKFPHDFEDDAGPSWVDTPGQDPGLPSVIPERNIDEFIVGVGDRFDREPVAGFAGKYFVVIVEFIARGYKVWMSLPKPLSEGQLRAAMGLQTSAPYPSDIIRAGPPDLASFRWIAHEAWQPYA